jgi:SpoVK/Ycf46/Vps4 family AAA+-type ATPase
MMAQAISHAIHKPLLSTNLSLHERFGLEDAIKTLYREARLRDGIVFLDECDDHFREGSSNSTDLLKEIELNPVITIMTANEPEKLDPALNRRIMRKVYFPFPDVSLRKRIWQLHFPDKTAFSGPLDWKSLATQFPLSGGQIRAAVQMVVSLALKDASHADVIAIAPDAVFNAAKHQCKDILDENNDETENTVEEDGEIHNAAQREFHGAEKTELDMLRSVISSYEKFLKGCETHDSKQMDSSSALYRKTGLKILIQCPNISKAYSFTKSIFRGSALQLLDDNLLVVIRRLEFGTEYSTRSEMRMKSSRNIFHKSRTRPSAIVLTDPYAILPQKAQSMDPKWDCLMEHFADALAPVILVTTAEKIPHKSLMKVFHYCISLPDVSASERIDHWAGFCSSHNISKDAANAFSDKIVRMSHGEFLRVLQMVSLQSMGSEKPLSRVDIESILLRRNTHNTISAPLFGIACQ